MNEISVSLFQPIRKPETGILATKGGSYAGAANQLSAGPQAFIQDFPVVFHSQNEREGKLEKSSIHKNLPEHELFFFSCPDTVEELHFVYLSACFCPQCLWRTGRFPPSRQEWTTHTISAQTVCVSKPASERTQITFWLCILVGFRSSPHKQTHKI